MKSPWPTKKLGEICEIIAGQAPPSEYYNDESKGIPFLTVNSFGEVYPKIERWTTKSLKESKEGDVLFSVAGSLGLVNLGINACITRSIFALRPMNDIVLQKFLFYALKKYGSQIALMGSGTAQKVITIKQISDFKIPLPPLPIQQKIVKILDTIQSAIDIHDRIIEKTKELKRSLMNLLFHYGLAGLRVKELVSSRVGELSSSELEKLGLRLKKTEVGEIPDHWEVVRLGEYFEFKNGINFKKEQKGKGKLVLDVLNMYTDSLYPNLNEIYRVEGSFSEEYYLKPGDILFVRSSLKQEGVGWSAVFQGFSEPVLFCGFLIRARPKTEKTDSNFLVYLFRTENFRNQIISQSGVVTITNLSQSILSNLLIPLPPLPEQQEIAEILQTIDQKIEIEKKKKELYEELFKTMLNKIMKQEIDVEKIEI